MVVAAGLGRERLTWPRTLGVLLTIAGVGLALGDKVVQPGAGHGWAGELAVLAAALCGAVCSVLYRPYLDRYPALPVGAFSMLASVAALAVLAGLGEGFFGAWPRFTPNGVGGAVHRGEQRGWLLPLALGTRPRLADAGDRVPLAQPRHRLVAGCGDLGGGHLSPIPDGARVPRLRIVGRQPQCRTRPRPRENAVMDANWRRGCVPRRRSSQAVRRLTNWYTIGLPICIWAVRRSRIAPDSVKTLIGGRDEGFGSMRLPSHTA